LKRSARRLSNSYRRDRIAASHPLEPLRRGGLRRAGQLLVRTPSAHRQSEHRTQAIAGMLSASYHPLLHESAITNSCLHIDRDFHT
jgi:hypothetical protein